MRTDPRELLAVGIFGRTSRLAERIEMLLRRGRTFSPRASMARASASAAALLALAMAASLTPRWIAFAQQQPKLQFEVASIKPNNSGESRVSGGFQPGGRYRVINYTLRALIAAAYLRPQVNPGFLIAGGPDWIDKNRFDVEAKAAAEFPSGPDGPTAPRRLMLQALLADRFGLKAHHEIRQGPTYALVFAKGDRSLGPHLRPSRADCAAAARQSQIPLPAQGCFARIGPGAIALGGATLSQFLNLLPRFVDRVVTDSTHLSGRFDIELAWTPTPGEWVAPPVAGSMAAPADGPSIFTALQEQLGLRLKPQTGSIDMLVIDHAERPSAN